MRSFLIISKNKKSKEEYLSTLFKEHKIGSFDIYTLASEKAIGIEDVRTMQKQLFLKPLQSQTKAVVIENADTLTLEAQNAMLKALEEPPAHTIIILTAQNEELLLPTIHSRCKIIKLQEDLAKLEDDDLSSYSIILESLTSMPVAEKLYLAQKFGQDKEKALTFLEAMIITAREQSIELRHCEDSDYYRRTKQSQDREIAALPTVARNDDKYKHIHVIKSFQNTHTVIATTNVSPRLALENLLLNI